MVAMCMKLRQSLSSFSVKVECIARDTSPTQPVRNFHGLSIEFIDFTVIRISRLINGI